MYYPHFQQILERQWDNLSGINVRLVGKLMKLLGIKTKTVLASQDEASAHKILR